MAGYAVVGYGSLGLSWSGRVQQRGSRLGMAVEVGPGGAS